MSKKNNGKAYKKYREFIIKHENERIAKNKETLKKNSDKLTMSEHDRAVAKARSERAKKPKVKPVIGSAVKQSKMLQR